MAEKKHYPLRIDKKLFNAIEQWAADEFRSINSHIEFILKDALIKAGRANSMKKEENQDDQ
jgi:hypothetical protein